MIPDITLRTDLAVVPVFVNAGAALLPAILAGAASAIALLFKPTELIRLCKAKPVLPLATIIGLLLIFLCFRWVASSPSQPPRPTAEVRVKSSGTDWTEVALEIVRQEERARAVSQIKPQSDKPVLVLPTGSLYYRGDASRTGYRGGGSPVDLLPVWSYAEPNTMYLSSPIVEEQMVLGASVYLDPPGSYGTIFRLDAETGRPRWVTEFERPPNQDEFKGFFSSPALSADRKYLVIGQGLHADTSSSLVCLEAESGRVAWTVPTPLHIESSPAIEGDIVVAAAGAVEVGPDHKPKGDPKGPGNPGYVFGVSLSTGKELWRYALNDPESSPAIQDGIAYIGSGINGSAVAALRIGTDDELKARGEDRLLWKVPTPHPATGSVTLANDLVLIGCGNGDYVFAAPNPEGYVIALDIKNGKERWRVRMPDAVLGPIAVHEGKAICPIRNGEVVALLVNENGRELWRSRISNNPLLAGTAFTGKHVYAVSSEGVLTVLDAVTGEIQEKHELNAAGKPGEMGLSLSSPFVVGGRVYVGSETGGLRCFAGKELR